MKNSGFYRTVLAESLLPEEYTIDVLHSEPVGGYSSWRYGRQVKQVHRVVESLVKSADRQGLAWLRFWSRNEVEANRG
ncbi:MAG: hypothetical protein ABS79_03195 [Planctomycetes bacterium SCN 63-9]|nr:MAG: hypothetical protein ABS79_03195 [Planctomycetes bacterium SCN 63-9]